MTNMTKGTTGELLGEFRDCGEPLHFTRRGSTLFIESGSCSRMFSVSLRGNSKDRRKLARRVERWLRGGAY